ncbi:GNAT family N-acetyltransferase [Nonomuraea lactucae]|uniref:GNAT family N-acetyltransferase n=1 Tax=Nonomuraea lactucae TaxID=2249762 RepID=UPI001F058C5A
MERIMRRCGLLQGRDHTAEIRAWAAQRRAAFAQIPTGPNQVWQLDFTEFETSAGGTWRIAGCADYHAKGCPRTVSARPVYAGVVEHSIYVHPGCQEHGIGRALLSAFVAACEDAGVWTIQTGIFPENVASLSLHQALGFRQVGIRERIGRHHGICGM